MKFYTFEINGRRHLGVGLKEQLIDLPLAYAVLSETRGFKPGLPPALPADMMAFVRLGEPALAAARETMAFMSKRPALPVGERAAYLFDEVKLSAPIPRPGKILCSGINYRSHKEENPNATMPSEPFFFSKLASAVVGPGEPIVCPKVSQQVDYEVEFAVVIGKRMKNTPTNEVMGHIFGYTILHDVSARDVQFKDNQITLGKNFDTFCPLGPCIVSADEMPDPGSIGLRSFVNGQQKQNGNTSDWVFPLPVLLSFLSHRMTLDPGDVISTGTPAGVGVFQKPQVFLKAGDVVRLEADRIGVLENPVVAES
jgi:2,4-didehydro-3-deoxy-L-rhamnonate hydrolase